MEGGGGWFCLWRAAPAACVDLDRLISQFREKNANGTVGGGLERFHN